MLLRHASVTAALIAGVLIANSAVSATAAASDSVDPSDRASVTAAYQSIWRPAQRVETGWTGSRERCDPGTITDAAQAATLSSINFARSLAGLTPAEFVPEYNTQAQAAALLMNANDALSHEPPSSWACYSDLGATGAGTSNLYQFRTVAPAISGYLDDPGATNTAAGHRRWILNPNGLRMGHGSTWSYDALKVFGSLGFADEYANPQWVPWPTSGYFPVQMEPEGRWSLSGQRGKHFDFSAAQVVVRDASGRALPVQTYPQKDGYGADTLTWEVSGLDTEPGTGEADYAVSVTGIGTTSGPQSASYTVRLFDPEATTPSATPTPTPTPPVATPAPTSPSSDRALKKPAKITGKAVVGHRLAATTPMYSPAASTYRYRWYRDGKAIAKATKQKYTLTKKDRGKLISVRITVPATKKIRVAVSDVSLTKRVR